jgi:hypothetical protein
METRLFALVTCLIGSLPGCIVQIVDDQAADMDDDEDTSSGDADVGDGDGGSGDGDGDSGDGDGDSGDGDGEPHPEDEGDGDPGDGDGDSGDGDSGDGDGDECGPYPSTEVMDCFGLVGQGFCSEGGGHVDIGTEIEWMNEPPHSGKHYPVWSSWGEKDEPVERGMWVHNIEHGGIVLIYNCPNGCEAELDVLRSVLDLRPDHSILLTPDPLLGGSRFAAISWTWVYAFEDPMIERLLCFVDQHYDHAPESVL